MLLRLFWRQQQTVAKTQNAGQVQGCVQTFVEKKISQQPSAVKQSQKRDNAKVIY